MEGADGVAGEVSEPPLVTERTDFLGLLLFNGRLRRRRRIFVPLSVFVDNIGELISREGWPIGPSLGSTGVVESLPSSPPLTPAELLLDMFLRVARFLLRLGESIRMACSSVVLECGIGS